jgi:hypothetical protein
MSRSAFPIHPDDRSLLPDAPAAVPWHVLEERRRRVLRNHGDTPGGLAWRGGLSWCELVAIVEDRPWRPMPAREAYERFRHLTLELCL